MKTFNKRLAAALTGGAVMLGATPLISATATDTIGVSATVDRSCTVTAGDLAFGTLVLAAKEVSADITVNCTAKNSETTLDISFDGGSHVDGTNRRMVHATDTLTFLNYTLSATSGGTALTVPGSITTAASGDEGITYSATVWGQVAGATTANVAGTYSDTVTVTVTYSNTYVSA